ncbi:MAG: magnesium transporter [candidate division WOR-3 bacterium]|jgi:magnesium transporter|nr:magnesium transporter [candidate division WOR-3 bacterium]MCR4424117.1 magnesium transporter [candidate division WOR-3 bacterium]MDH7519464.1 magnesium transporter [bacterium]
MPARKRLNILKQLLEPEIRELLQAKDWQGIKDTLTEWPAPDIADLIASLPDPDKVVVFRLLPKKLQSEVFAEFDPDKQLTLIKNLSDEQVRSLMAELAPDDRTELFEDLPPAVIQRALNLLSPEDRRETLLALGFPENSVGRLLTPDYVAVFSHWTVKQALEHIRTNGIDAETINTVYVVDEKNRLLDDIPLRRLILAAPDEKIEAIMDQQFISIEASADQEEAARVMERYDLLALPVVNSDGVLLGIVTIDDILDVLREEQTEDITKISGIHPGKIDLTFITKLREVPLKLLYRSRVVWLLALLIMDLITGGIIQGFSELLAQYVVLVTFLPVLVDTAGNAGSQSATLVIRALAVGTVRMRDWLFLLGREILLALGLGLTMGLGISIMGFVRGGLKIAPVVILAMVVNVIVGCAIGIVLPFIFTRLKRDPATASTPLITTLADIFGTAIYLGIAYLFLGRPG